ncbi:MAG TPA: MBL fold metallo-hydrolase [Planctomycetaceae bacterium]|nr:MBL fold metallo-hydrolase [Planctomycetaceae bacterium]
MRSLFSMGFALLALVGTAITASADERDGRLDIYFIDVEGGAATLFVTPAGETMLIDSGYPDYGGRDRDRILKVVKDAAGKSQIDHAVVSHWHLDHYGNHAALASQIKIGQFWDRGIPESLMEDDKFGERIVQYRAASQNKSKAVKVGDTLPLKSSATPLSVKVVTASGEVLPNEGPANPYSDKHVPQKDDPSDNAKSISLLMSFGKFRFLCCGDLTWNTEAKLMTPKNPLGQVDLFMVTHHGLEVSNNPVLVLAIDPVVAVSCNGPTKGAHANTIATLKQVKSLQAMYQLHRNIKLAPEAQATAENIANQEDTNSCKGNYIKASVAKDGSSYTVTVSPNGKPSEFMTR